MNIDIIVKVIMTTAAATDCACKSRSRAYSLIQVLFNCFNSMKLHTKFAMTLISGIDREMDGWIDYCGGKQTLSSK